jgi:hypothetical protein
MTHITFEFHRVRPKPFLMLWYVLHKQCSYLVSRLVLSSNGLNWASTWASSPKSTYGTFSAKPYTYLVSRLALSPNELNQASTWASSPRSIIRCIQNNFWDFGTFGANMHLLPSRLALYQINWIKHPLELRHLGVLLGASKMISKPTVSLAQPLHLSCTDTNTISN